MPQRWFLAIFFLIAPVVPLRAQPAPPSAAQPAALSLDAGSCETPTDLGTPDSPFQAVADALHTAHMLQVLAVGSATMLGPDRSTDTSFPAVMARLVRAAVPGSDVALTVRSGRGMAAADMLPIMKDALTRRRFQLVIWQTGTVEAVRALPPDDFLQTLTEGIEAAREAGADIVLVDPQYSRFLRANAYLDPYLLVMRQAGMLSDAALFPRFDLMKRWVDDGRLDMERADRVHRASIARSVHECLGRALADFVLAAAGMSPH